MQVMQVMAEDSTRYRSPGITPITTFLRLQPFQFWVCLCMRLDAAAQQHITRAAHSALLQFGYTSCTVPQSMRPMKTLSKLLENPQ